MGRRVAVYIRPPDRGEVMDGRFDDPAGAASARVDDPVDPRQAVGGTHPLGRGETVVVAGSVPARRAQRTVRVDRRRRRWGGSGERVGDRGDDLDWGLGVEGDFPAALITVVRMTQGPPRLGRVGVRCDAQLCELVGAGEDDLRHQRIPGGAPAAGATEGSSDPGGVATAGQIAGRYERLLDGLGHRAHRRTLAATAGAGGAATAMGAPVFDCRSASALTAKMASPWIAHWSR